MSAAISARGTTLSGRGSASIGAGPQRLDEATADLIHSAQVDVLQR